jgi:hypothetical protein
MTAQTTADVAEAEAFSRYLELRAAPAAAANVCVPAPAYLDRTEAITRIRQALRTRSGKAWSVSGDRGTAWGWIRISAPPRRLVGPNGETAGAGRYHLSEADRAELSELLGEDVHHQGVSIPASGAYRRAYVERAETGHTDATPTPYWD